MMTGVSDFGKPVLTPLRKLGAGFEPIGGPVDDGFTSQFLLTFRARADRAVTYTKNSTGVYSSVFFTKEER